MMTFRRLIAVGLTMFVLVPVMAAGRPACCVKKAAPAVPSCCAAMAVSAAKGCCKPPQAPKPEARAKTDVSPALLSAAPAALPSAQIPCRATDVEIARVARLDHRAPSPADSPPDLLALHRTLLI